MWVIADLMTSIRITYLIWLRMFAEAHEVGLAITVNNVGKTQMVNIGFIITYGNGSYVVNLGLG